MSRIGKKPILIPAGVDVKIDGQKITVSGPRGEVSKEFRSEVEIVLKEKKIMVKPKKEGKKSGALWGTTAAVLSGLIKGVVGGYEKKLEMVGTAYRANIEGDQLVLDIGFSHPVKVRAPEGIKFSVEKNIIIVSGIDKELVGQVAAKIRAVRPPEPYKGKGIRYSGEHIRRKLGKKAVATAT